MSESDETVNESSDPGRPAATTVDQYYERAFRRVFAEMITEMAGRGGRLDWEDEALRVTLRDLDAARRARPIFGEVESVEELRRQGKPDLEWMELAYLQADVVAAINTLLHYKWVQDERLVAVGARLLGFLDRGDERGAEGPA